jgi:formate-dependent nitrite reductase membrane component NrfD
MNSKILLFLLIVLVLFVALGFRAPGMQLMVASGLGVVLFWIGVVILGLLIPLFVGMGKKVRTVSTSVIVSLLVLVGGFCLRYVILLSGQLA